MEDLISILAKKLSNCSLGDIEILLDQSIIIQWETSQEIKASIMNNTSLKTKDIIHLYYSRYIQTLFAEEVPIPEVCFYGVTLLTDLKKCISDFSLENCIKILIRKIGNSMENSSDIDNFLKLAKEIKRVKTELGADNLIDIESQIYLGLKASIVEKRDFDIWLLRDCYLNIDSISTDNSIKQKINDLVAVKAYSWFQKTYRDLIQNNLDKNISSALDSDSKRIHNWITSIDCRPDINQKIENLEPLIGQTDTYEKDSNNIYHITEKHQLASPGANDCLVSIKKTSYHLAVYKKRIRDTGDLVAVKSFISEKRENLQNGLNEKEIYEKLSTKNMDFTLKYYGHFTSAKRKNSVPQYKLDLVLEYCENTLSDEIVELKNQNRVYQSHELAQNIYVLLDLFKKLRKEKVNHCDIKPQNIFIAAGRRFKIGDFDLSGTFKTNEASNLGTKYYEFQGGTISYMAPEVKQQYIESQASENPNGKRKYSKERSDVYSLGLVFLLMTTFKPVVGLNEQACQSELYQTINHLELDWEKRLLRKMLAFNFRDRPRFSEALEMLEEDSEFILCLRYSN